MFKKLWNDDAGVVTIEYLVLGTFIGLALIVGVHSLASGINSELIELGGSLSQIDQSWYASGYSACHAHTNGASAVDLDDRHLLAITGDPSVTTIDIDACR